MDFQQQLIERSQPPSPSRWKSHAANWLGITRPTLDTYLRHAKDGRFDKLPSKVIEKVMGGAPGPAGDSRAALREEMLLNFAAGLVALQEEMDAHGHPRAPYPAALQRGLDVAGWLNIAEGSVYPVTLAELLVCASRPVYEWCAQLGEPLADEYYASRLLEDMEVTRDCLSLAARLRQDAEHELFKVLMRCCEEAGVAGQELYTAWRRTVIEVPVAGGYTQLLARERIFMQHLDLAQRLINEFYVRLPSVHATSGKVHLCPSTNTRLRKIGGRWTTEMRDEAAQRRLQREGPRLLDYTPDVLELRRSARLFWALPGWHELQLRDAAVNLGWDVELWPKFDTVDLVLRRAGSAKRYAIDLKDHLSAQGLARSFERFKGYKTHIRLIVVPDYLEHLNPEYRKTFMRARASFAKEKVEIVAVSGLLKLLAKESE
ncbi:MAG TPA: hypothetical protein VF169_15060 [Albitalea sp.]|uniref:restriction endonuclease-related protein n=1 Tax=Piscinibacter sp. TaxID=1903157 RepID=UPI002ED56640